MWEHWLVPPEGFEPSTSRFRERRLRHGLPVSLALPLSQ